jgi:hypothetical protein
MVANFRRTIKETQRDVIEQRSDIDGMLSRTVNRLSMLGARGSD